MKKSLMIIACAIFAGGALFGQTARHRAPYRRGAYHSLYRPATLDLRAPAVYRARFVTTKGEFVIEVHRAWAPRGADRFYNLVKFGFFNGTRFFRVVPGFVVQFGLSGNPRLNQIWSHAAIKDDPVDQSNMPGMVTYATGGPNTRTTQVFINLRDNSMNLDSKGFAPFGRVVEGMSVVEALYGGYGDGPPFGDGPDQNLITKKGEAYLSAKFPKLDEIKFASIVPLTLPPKPKPPVQKSPR